MRKINEMVANKLANVTAHRSEEIHFLSPVDSLKKFLFPKDDFGALNETLTVSLTLTV